MYAQNLPQANLKKTIRGNLYAPAFPHKRDHHFNLESTPTTTENIASHDCLDHDGFDCALLQTHAGMRRHMRRKEDRNAIGT
jgi:hypothetical protein